MQSFLVLCLLALGTQAQLVKPGYQKTPYSVRVPSQRLHSPQHVQSSTFRTPQDRPQPPLYHQAVTYGFPAVERSSVAVAATAVQAAAPVAGKNIYGENLVACGEIKENDLLRRPRIGELWATDNTAPKNVYGDNLVPDYCGFSEDSPKICTIPKDLFVEQNPKCASIFSLSAGSFAKANLYEVGSVNTVRCDAISSDVLDSQFSSNMWNDCDFTVREYPFEQLYVTKEETSYPMSAKGTWNLGRDTRKGRCVRFRQAMRMVIDACAKQAPSESAKSAILSKWGEKFSEASMSLALAETDELTLDARGKYFIPGLVALTSFMLAFIGLTKFRSYLKFSPVLQQPLVQ